MNTIDDRLDAAAADVRATVSRVPGRASHGAVHRQRATWTGRIAATAVALVALIVAGSLSIRGDQPANSSRADIPLLLVDVKQLGSDLTLALVDDHTVAPSPQDPPPLRSYGPPSAGPADPRLWLVTYPEGADFFRGEGFRDPGWKPLAVPSGRAYAITEGWSTAIMWQPTDRNTTVLRIQGFGVDPSVVHKAALSAVEDESGWALQILPPTFVELFAGYDHLAPGERVVTFQWSGSASRDQAPTDETASVTLWIYEGLDRSIAERSLFGFLPSGPESAVDVKALDIRGNPGVQFATQDGTVYHWLETPTVFARLHIQGTLDPEQVVDAIIETDPHTWHEISESWDPPTTSIDDGPTSTLAPTSTIGG